MALTLAGRLRSIACAARGIGMMLRTQHNAWIHAFATAGVIVLGVACRLSRLEWVVIVLAMMFVWVAEALNTACELIVDLASPAIHPVAGRAKDMAAGAVLIAAIGAVVIGLLVLGPHLAAMIGAIDA